MKAFRAGFAALVLVICGRPQFEVLAAADGGPDSFSRWEYRVLTKDQLLELGNKDLAAGLNKLGAEGWELAAVDGQYIFKRHKLRDQIEELERQIGVIESDVESWRDRVAWAERMVKKGFMTDQHLQFERAQLIKTENALDAARKALKSLPSEPKGSADKQPKRE